MKRILGTPLITDLIAIVFLVSADKTRTLLNSLPRSTEARNLRCRVLAQQRDKTAEGEQGAAALAVAYDYKPALELKF